MSLLVDMVVGLEDQQIVLKFNGYTLRLSAHAAYWLGKDLQMAAGALKMSTHEALLETQWIGDVVVELKNE